MSEAPHVIPFPTHTVPLHTKSKGDVAEAYVTAPLLELGKAVLKPLGDNQRYDLVIDDGGRFVRVQCKTAQTGKGGDYLCFPACSTYNHTGYGKKGYHGECDVFAVFYPPTRAVYLIPVSECGATEVKLRFTPPKNNQRVRVRYAADYIV